MTMKAIIVYVFAALAASALAVVFEHLIVSVRTSEDRGPRNPADISGCDEVSAAYSLIDTGSSREFHFPTTLIHAIPVQQQR